jgi:hypothetical protein
MLIKIGSEWTVENAEAACGNAEAFRPKESLVPLWFFTGNSNRQLHARVKLPDAFTGNSTQDNLVPV